MNLKNYINTIRKKIWIIILLPLVAGLASAYVSYKMYVPQFEASVSLMVINKEDDTKIYLSYSDILAAQQLVKECKEIIKSRTVTKAVVEELGMSGLKWSDLAGFISVNAKDGTRILDIKVRHNDPKLAELLANKVSEVFMRKATELIKIENIQVIDIAERPEVPLKAAHKKNIAIAVFVALIASIGIVLLIEELNDRLKSIDDIEENLNLKVIGIIPDLRIK